MANEGDRGTGKMGNIANRGATTSELATGRAPQTLEDIPAERGTSLDPDRETRRASGEGKAGRAGEPSSPAVRTGAYGSGGPEVAGGSTHPPPGRAVNLERSEASPEDHGLGRG